MLKVGDNLEDRIDAPKTAQFSLENFRQLAQAMMDARRTLQKRFNEGKFTNTVRGTWDLAQDPVSRELWLQIKTHLDAIYLIFSTFTSDQIVNRKQESVEVKGGKAIPPIQAGQCLEDHHRTMAFMCGLMDALETVKRRVPGEKLRFVEAGSGPFAFFGLLIASMLSEDELEIAVIDIFPENIASVRKLYEGFGLKYRIEYICEDINDVNLKAHNFANPHLAVVETMDSGLTRESQLLNTATLARQMHTEGIFLPEEITLELVFRQQFFIDKNNRQGTDKLFQFQASYSKGSNPAQRKIMGEKIPHDIQETMDDYRVEVVLRLTAKNAERIRKILEYDGTLKVKMYPDERMARWFSSRVDKQNDKFTAFISTWVRTFSDWLIGRGQSDITADTHFKEFTLREGWFDVIELRLPIAAGENLTKTTDDPDDWQLQIEFKSYN